VKPLNPGDAGITGPVLLPFLGSEMGGSHVSCFTLAQALMGDFGTRCVVIAAAGTLIAREAARRGFEVAEIAEPTVSRHNPAYDVLRLLPRLQFLRRFGSGAILHCNDLGTLQSWGLPAMLLGIPRVYHHRALNRPILPNRMVVRLANAVVCISRECRQNVGYLDDQTASTTFNPFSIAPVTDVDTARRELLGAEADIPGLRLIGNVGNFWHRKRPFFFLDTCRIIADHDPLARFYLFGRDGEIKLKELRAHAGELGLEKFVTFAGFRLPGERNIAPMDALLIPAVREPFGRTLVEAILLGTPYIATHDAGHAEIWDQWKGGATLPPTASAAEYAAKTLSVLENRDAFVLDAEQKAAVAQELSARTHATKILSIYRRFPKIAAA
jgi:glycosyltransferase involved in cell wall biosynthesis